MTAPAAAVVVDASAVVDLMAGTELATAVASRLRGTVGHAPAHVDAEVLSALGRLNRAGDLGEAAAEAALARVGAMPVTRHPVRDLLLGAWRHRASIRLVDGLYVALAERLEVPLLTTDARLARACESAELVSQ